MQGSPEDVDIVLITDNNRIGGHCRKRLDHNQWDTNRMVDIRYPTKLRTKYMHVCITDSELHQWN